MPQRPAALLYQTAHKAYQQFASAHVAEATWRYTPHPAWGLWAMIVSFVATLLLALVIW